MDIRPEQYVRLNEKVSISIKEVSRCNKETVFSLCLSLYIFICVYIAHHSISSYNG